MKRRDIRITVLCLFTLLLALPAPAQVGNKTSMSTEINGKIKHQEKRNGYTFDIELKGDIEMNEAETDIVSISRGGYIEIEEKVRGTRHQLRIEGLSGGRLERKYRLNGRKRDFAEIDRDWYENALLTMIRETGVDAERRTSRILQREGVDGLFKEIGMIESSSSRVRYMTYLFEQAKLNDNQLQRAAKMAKDIPSSGDRSRFLISTAAQFLSSEDATPYFFDAVESIPSSGDKMRVLMRLVEEDLLDEREIYIEAIQLAKGIPSSGDRSRFLMKAADFYLAEASDLYFKAVASIPSSGDKTRVLMTLVEKRQLTDRDSYLEAMEVAQTISSSGDRARFLIAAAPMYLAAANDAYFKAVNSIPSSGDQARVLIQLAELNDLDKVSILSFLQAAKHIPSSGDKARVLLAVSADVAGDDDLVEAYIATAETISASGDYKRALSALLK